MWGSPESSPLANSGVTRHRTQRLCYEMDQQSHGLLHIGIGDPYSSSCPSRKGHRTEGKTGGQAPVKVTNLTLASISKY
jgi:hypothetical protein